MKCGKFGLAILEELCIAEEDSFPFSAVIGSSFSFGLLLVFGKEFISFLTGSGDFLKQFETRVVVVHGGHSEDTVDMESMHWTEQHFLCEDTLHDEVSFSFSLLTEFEIETLGRIRIKS